MPDALRRRTEREQAAESKRRTAWLKRLRPLTDEELAAVSLLITKPHLQEFVGEAAQPYVREELNLRGMRREGRTAGA